MMIFIGFNVAFDVYSFTSIGLAVLSYHLRLVDIEGGYEITLRNRGYEITLHSMTPRPDTDTSSGPPHQLNLTLRLPAPRDAGSAPTATISSSSPAANYHSAFGNRRDNMDELANLLAIEEACRGAMQPPAGTCSDMSSRF